MQGGVVYVWINDYNCNMEEVLKSISPIEAGDGYRDYLVSHIAKVLSADIAYVRIDEGGIASVVFRTVGGFKTYSRYLPLVEYSGSMTGYTDLRIRYFCDGSSPAWVSVYLDGIVEVNLLSVSN